MSAKKNTLVVPTPAERLGFHYFGTTCFGWQCANTRKEVLEQLARAAGRDMLTRNRKAECGGLYALTCRVEAPITASYHIDQYPVGVETEDFQHHAIISINGASLALEPSFQKELAALDKGSTSPLSEHKQVAQ